MKSWWGWIGMVDRRESEDSSMIMIPLSARIGLLICKGDVCYLIGR